MKRNRILHCLVLCLLTVLLLVALHISGNAGEALERPVSIYIATDLHYIAPELMGNGAYFREPTPQMDGKVVHFAPEITDAFLATVLKDKPDVLILSGDLTLNGAVLSMTRLAEKLERVQQAGIQVLTMAGNHDVDGTAGSYAGDEIQLVEAATSEQYKALYSKFGADQAVSRDPYGTSYLYQVTPKLQILMLDTNCYGKGFVKDDTLAWLETELKRAEAAGVKTISVSHQNIYAHNERLSFGYQLYNATVLEALFAKYDVRCNFSGHIHVQSIHRGVVTEIATSSLTVSPLQYGKVLYDGQRLQYRAQVTDVQPIIDLSGRLHPELEQRSFAEYAQYYFEEVARRQVRQAYAESGKTQAEIELLAETFAGINAAYFAGSNQDALMWQTGMELWRKEPGNFFLAYIETMLKAMEQENRQVAVDLW